MSSLPLPPEEWHVLDHGPLEQIASNCWYIVGSLPNGTMPRTSVIATHQDRDGPGLLVHSAIAIDDPALQALLEVAPPRWLVVPCAMHRLDAPAWKARFPDMRVICPPDARDAVSEVLPVDATFDELTDAFGPETGITLRPLAGVGGKEWALTIHHPDDSVSLVMTDTIFNLPHQRGMSGLLLRLIGSSGGPRVTFLARQMIVQDKAALAEVIRELAQLEGLARMIPAHGDIIDHDVRRILHAAADKLHP
jgi:hypothetical protein